MRLPAMFVCLFDCLSVSKITQKRVHGFGWNFARRQLSGRGRTDQLLSPIRIIVRIQEPDLHRIFQFQQNYSKTRALIWMKCCVLTDVGTWTNWLTFEPYRDHSPDAGTGLLFPIAYALQRGILLRRENPTYHWNPLEIGRPSKQRRVVLRRRNTVVGGKCALPSALLVFFFYLLTRLLSNGWANFHQVFTRSRLCCVVH